MPEDAVGIIAPHAHSRASCGGVSESLGISPVLTKNATETVVGRLRCGWKRHSRLDIKTPRPPFDLRSVLPASQEAR